MVEKRSARLPVYRPKPLGTGDEFLDRVSLGGVKTYTVAADKKSPLDNPLISVVMTGSAPSRQPYDFYDPPNPRNIIELNPGVRPGVKDHKFCINCGDWVKRDKFSEDKRNKDGLRSWCKACRNEQERKHYWLRKMQLIEERIPKAA